MTQNQNEKTAKTILPAGTLAPDFSLVSGDDQAIHLNDLRGRPVILAFYPADFSPTCTDQMSLYNEVLPVFEQFNARLLGISVDSKWAHKAFARERHLQFPLLADFEPKGDVARAYGAYDFQKGRSERALFVIDADGVIRWSYLAPNGTNPGADGILQALEAIPSKAGNHG